MLEVRRARQAHRVDSRAAHLCAARAGRVVSLRDAIMRQVDPLHEDATAYRPEGVAIAVLAMPEMEAIRTALNTAAWQATDRNGADMVLALELWNLPQSVVDWVIGR